ncbi:hypothetical protein M413DRAFT_18406 [Hebeloma cylindrosporum]|uniref:Phospholipase n=1 Tax=Hebeloma cylindrosporum TaxID=76867 RepID=A0A0C3CGR7_HEBCY|nr:hypothetical protein M413DRAFT_18406 [Hebeloma cylindrosporum h7]
MPDILQVTGQNKPPGDRKDTHDSESTVTPANQTLKLHFRESDNLDQPIHLHDAHVPSNIQHEHSDRDSEDHILRHAHTSISLNRYKPPPDTPAARTGPPRSLSFAYGLPVSPSTANANGYFYGWAESAPPDSSVIEDGDLSFSASHQAFRGALEYQDRKGKRRQRNPSDDSWNINPMRWFHESPKDDKPPMDFPPPPAPAHDPTNTHTGEENEELPAGTASDPEHTSTSATFFSRPNRGASLHGSGAERATTGGTQKDKDKDHKDFTTGTAKWAKLRSLLPNLVHPQESTLPGPSAVTSQAVNITDELITGGLSTLMLRLWFERDEKSHRRVPVLFHRLRIRVSDSLHPMHRQASVFRIECEYAGAARWVVYRELRDFLSLHAHYAVSNVYNRNVDHMPEFPKTSLPYFKFLKEKGDGVGKADFARLQREALENYLIELIRAVMFHPSSNRLAGFLEISALSIALAQSGGAQAKAGFLKIELHGTGGGGFGRKSAGWRERKVARWCIVRESYLVVLEEPGELDVWDVFLLDPDFRIERPKRYYRQNLGNLLHSEKSDAEQHDGEHQEHLGMPQIHLSPPDADRRSIISSIKTRVSKIFHIDPHHPSPSANGHADDGNHSDNDADSSDSASSIGSRVPTPMLDPSTHANPLEHHADEQNGQAERKKPKQGTKKHTPSDVSKHTFYIVNSQMRLKLYAKNERQMLQFITGLEKAAASSHYVGNNRFDSFAPIRLNVAAQWLVDGRDYFWNLSRAMLLAKETIYIHDWWLSPELQLRRPNKDRYRLDRLLERKAKEGVKIYVILYQEVSNRTTPTDSNYAKQRLLGLHPNIMVQRSPSHLQTGTFFWAHHEKMCVIDQTIAFLGGLDLCFGRWDTPQHVLTDDTADTDRSEIWPGKDYSNPRLSDFYNLHKPEEDMYDRTKVPRMPWHDVSMQIVGQPAMDLARHFVQRYNHSRIMPFLLPPPEFRPGELTQLGLTGTCELQICRSAGPWSLGTPGRIEHSIQNAYLKAIQMSEHFVYIENQFFITSTVVNDVKVENNIGDAIVHRIIRAHRDRMPWKCCIMVPLLPGFTFPVDHSDASAIRIILECQNRTIARGPNSIFSRLRKEGIEPEDYIAVFSLRNWAKMRGDVLTTEQVYIHAKVCIVDDRLAIIGSANINERSQRGDRDSEVAAVIRDTDMIDSTMAGKPFKVGRFAHTLRDDLMTREADKAEYDQEAWDPDSEQAYGSETGVTYIKKSKQKAPVGNLAADALGSGNQATNAGIEATSKKTEEILRKMGFSQHSNAQGPKESILANERKDFNREGQLVNGFASSVVPTLEEKTIAEQGTNKQQGEESNSVHYENGGPKSPTLLTDDGVSKSPSVDAFSRSSKSEVSDEDQAPLGSRATMRENRGRRPGRKNVWTVPTTKPQVEPQNFEDPISDAFWKNIWVASAVHNTEIYRKVFHAIPDDHIDTWKQYKEFIAHHERLSKPTYGSTNSEPVARMPSESGDEGTHVSQASDTTDMASRMSREDGEECPPTPLNNSSFVTSHNEEPVKHRRHAKGAEPFEKWERDEMEKLLGQLNGQLVLYSNRFLEGEDIANNFLFNADRLLPLPIYV